MFEVSSSKGFSVFYTEAIANMIVGVASTAGSVGLYLAHGSLDAYLILSAAGSLVLPVLAWHMMRRNQMVASPSPLPREKHALVWRTLIWHTGFTLVGLLSTKSVDTYLLGLHAAPAYLAYYSVAAALTKAGLDLLSTGFSSMLLPFISRAKAEGGHERVQAIFSGSVRFYQFVGILVAGGGYLLSSPMIEMLYGPSYKDAIPALRVMSLVGGLMLPHAAFSAIFVATDSHRARLTFIILSSLISVITSFAFIPSMGYNGALMSVFVGNVSTFVIVAAAAHFLLRIRYPVKHALIQWGCAGLPLGLLILFMPAHAPLWLACAACALFGATFVALTINCGGWTAEDIGMLRGNSTVLTRLIDSLTLPTMRRT
jgi:O-antigen/teichoic acid export membrane protein